MSTPGWKVNNDDKRYLCSSTESKSVEFAFALWTARVKRCVTVILTYLRRRCFAFVIRVSSLRRERKILIDKIVCLVFAASVFLKDTPDRVQTYRLHWHLLLWSCRGYKRFHPVHRSDNGYWIFLYWIQCIHCPWSGLLKFHVNSLRSIAAPFPATEIIITNTTTDLPFFISPWSTGHIGYGYLAWYHILYRSFLPARVRNGPFCSCRFFGNDIDNTSQCIGAIYHRHRAFQQFLFARWYWYQFDWCWSHSMHPVFR